MRAAFLLAVLAVPSLAAAEGAASGGASAGGTIWARKHGEEVVEFTNVPPVGRNWKVVYKTGPGKASAVRSATSDVRPPRDVSTDRFARYDGHILDSVSYYGIPVPLLRAIIKTESDFDPNVVSSAGARGLMQLMPETAKSMGVLDSFDPRQNIFGGARYLQLLVQRYCRKPTNTANTETVCSSDQIIKVVAAYHAGPGAVAKYGGMPPYETTKEYVKNVLERYTRFRTGAGPTGKLVAER